MRGINVHKMGNYSVQSGVSAELRVAAKFVELGYVVLFPYGGNERYDLVVEKDGRFLRVQVKSVRLKNGRLPVKLQTYSMRSKGRIVQKSYGDDIDCIAVYCQDNEEVYFLSTESFIGKTAIYLRIDTPKNHQFANINWAKDYLDFKILERC